MIKVWLRTTWTDHDGWKITFEVDGNGVTESLAIKDAKRRTQAFYNDCKWARNFRDVKSEIVCGDKREVL